MLLPTCLDSNIQLLYSNKYLQARSGYHLIVIFYSRIKYYVICENRAYVKSRALARRYYTVLPAEEYIFLIFSFLLLPFIIFFIKINFMEIRAPFFLFSFKTFPYLNSMRMWGVVIIICAYRLSLTGALQHPIMYKHLFIEYTSTISK